MSKCVEFFDLTIAVAITRLFNEVSVQNNKTKCIGYFITSPMLKPIKLPDLLLFRTSQPSSNA